MEIDVVDDITGFGGQMTVDENGCISKEYLNAYFHGATGLSFRIDDTDMNHL